MAEPLPRCQVSAAVSNEATFALSRGPPSTVNAGASRVTGSSSLFRWPRGVARFLARAWLHFFPRPTAQVVPLPDYQVSLQIDGSERLRWHHGPSYPRPFFYPLVGPSGSVLTRMGHPGAPDHDHHRSIWFAHAKVLGIDFWSDTSKA